MIKAGLAETMLWDFDQLVCLLKNRDDHEGYVMPAYTDPEARETKFFCQKHLEYFTARGAAFLKAKRYNSQRQRLERLEAFQEQYEDDRAFRRQRGLE
jgi:hypothetical protein